jgi:ribosome biogenesis GTPase / thiamine phosphate phosphatase
MTGIVTRSTGSWHMVSIEGGNQIPCKLKGNFRIKGIRTTNPVAVGDRVEVDLQSDGIGVITEVLERNNYIIRKATKLSKESHIIAANVDQLLIVATLAFPRTSTGFIDRVLVTAEAYHIPAIIVFNKTDLYKIDELSDWLEDTEKIYTNVGYPCLRVSAKTGDGLEQLKEVVKDKISLVSGHSGVGKSSLINALQPGLNLKVKEISSYHMKGQHATTFPEMFTLSFGGYIIDTPGIKEFGLTHFDKGEIAERFPEMRALMHLCRYSNCTHTHEPGCEVLKAVEDGRIHPERYQNYLSIYSGHDWNEK